VGDQTLAVGLAALMLTDVAGPGQLLGCRPGQVHRAGQDGVGRRAPLGLRRHER
jgi:hypothetical protein